MDTPVAASSPTDSLTSKGTEDLEMEFANMGNTPARSSVSTRNTPAESTTDATNNNVNGESDQIIVDAPSNSNNHSTLGAEEDDEEEYLDDDDDEGTPATFQHKRKRSTVNYILNDDLALDTASPSSEPRPKRRQNRKDLKVRGVLIGVWRDSSEQDDNDKHVIYGFIDNQDRLRTRIYAMNKRGDELVGNAPSGAGGCWVTIERIIFEPHLRDLTAQQLKEYVRLRHEAIELDAASREAAEADAVEIAKVKATEFPNLTPSQIKIASHPRRSLGRTSSHRESAGAPGFQAVNSPRPTTPNGSGDVKPINGVPLGFWLDSDAIRDEDKHAVYGVLSENDCFRIKVQKVTRDGRPAEGNYPTGAGSMWIAYDKMVLEPFLQSLSKAEVKEYSRIRQRDLLVKENDEQRRSNESRAYHAAKAAVSGGARGPNHNSISGPSFPLINGSNSHLSGTSSPHANAGPSPVSNGRPSTEPELRHSARSEQKLQARRQAEAEAAAQRARQEKKLALEAQQEASRKELAAAEASSFKEKADREYKQNLHHLNKVWLAQQNATKAAASPANSAFGGQQPTAPSTVVGGDDDVLVYGGIRYDRKKSGPFQGKLVGPGSLIQVDGEDYVEYRVLMKPSFF